MGGMDDKWLNHKSDIFENGIDEEKPTVLVTGFGPFGIHKVNSSWVAVQELTKLGLGDQVNLIVQEIPVIYSTIQEIVPALWEAHRPKLVVHVGVSGVAEELTLEQLAHNTGYKSEDVNGSCPSTNCCIDGAPEVLHSDINMGRVCEIINNSSCGVNAVVSHDPGRYLCDYSYFTSLSIDKSATAFIHVPPLHRPYTAEQLGLALKIAILAMLEEILRDDDL